jgi:NAD(P)-dependent dehydrogenase (short-subunit alcohol dehydrogenase family)
MSQRKTIFISGAARGIGLATAKFFADKNWFVGLMDINGDELNNALNFIGNENGIAIIGDVSDFESYQKAIQTFVKRTDGQLNVLLNNAGITYLGKFEDATPERNKKVVEVNLLGPINGVKAALLYLKNTSGSKIINMASASAIFGNPEITVYAGTKAGVKNLTEGWSLAFEKYGIGVSSIMPIYVNTNMVTDYCDKAQTYSKKDVKLEPDQIAKTIFKAVHSNKLHWIVGADAKTYAFLSRLLPAGLVRKLAYWAMNYK